MNKSINVKEKLQKGLVLHQAGRLAEAEQAYRQILCLKPSCPDANNLLGALFYQRGQYKKAIDFIGKAVRKKPKNAEYLRNMGSSFGALGKLDDAIKYFRKALRINPASRDLHYNLGCALQQKNLHDDAVKCFEMAISFDPHSYEVLNNLGSSLLLLKRPEEALASFRKVLEIKPDLPDAHINVGLALGNLGWHDEAIAHYQNANKILPGNTLSLINTGNALIELRRFEEALEVINRALLIDPKLDAAYYIRGVVLDELGQTNLALEAFKKSIDLNPKSQEAHMGLGAIFQQLGHKTEACAAYQKVISINVDNTDAHRRLARLRNHEFYDNEIKLMEVVYSKPDITSEQKMYLGFGLGAAFENIGDFKQAFEFFVKANHLKRETLNYDVGDDRLYFERICSVFSSSFFSERNRTGFEDDTPIFILGMPRSGTSLVEQILASHPEVFGGGELSYMTDMCFSMLGQAERVFPEAVEDLSEDQLANLGRNYVEKLRNKSPQASYITDKLPNNFIFIGLIKTILPNAKVIHCKRGQIDTCLSIFKNLFTGHIPFAYNLEKLAEYYQLYLDTMEHWYDLFPGKIIDVQYEKLVVDHEFEIKELLNSCDLPFHEDCLNFYKTNRSVKTASFSQVREPIYQKSVELWKQYESELQPLLIKMGIERSNC